MAANILHELVHCFEPVTVELDKINVLVCSVITGQDFPTEPTTTSEQGEIFEIMMFGGIIGRIDNTVYAYCSKVDYGFQFAISSHSQYRHFFRSHDLTILYNIVQAKKRRILISNFLRSVGQRLVNFLHLRWTQTVDHQ